jgi:S-methylmethionine-dependent homocysteine/selenocysteine methylase
MISCAPTVEIHSRIGTIMSMKRARLPHLDGGLFLTDGGIETDLIFNDGMELPHFAAFDLLKTEKGTAALKAYYGRYATIARANGVGFILESPTWRASADWGRKLGYSRAALAEANAKAIRLMVDLRQEYQSKTTPMVVSGCVGPRGDGYDPGAVMSADEAQSYHAEQIGVFAESDADMVTASP